MHKVCDQKVNNECLIADHSRSCEKEAYQNLTKMLINDINGVMHCILGNTELLKIKYVYKLDQEAMNFIHKIEDNSENLISLLNRFVENLHPASKFPDEKSCTADFSKTNEHGLRQPHSIKNIK